MLRCVTAVCRGCPWADGYAALQHHLQRGGKLLGRDDPVAVGVEELEGVLERPAVAVEERAEVLNELNREAGARAGVGVGVGVEVGVGGAGARVCVASEAGSGSGRGRGGATRCATARGDARANAVVASNEGSDRSALT